MTAALLIPSVVPAVTNHGGSIELPGGGWAIFDVALEEGYIDLESKTTNVSGWHHMGILVFAPDGRLLNYDVMTTAGSDLNFDTGSQIRGPNYRVQSSGEADLFSSPSGNSTESAAILRHIPHEAEHNVERVLLVAWSSGTSDSWSFSVTGDASVLAEDHAAEYVFLTENDFAYNARAHVRGVGAGGHAFVGGTANLPVKHTFLGVFDVLGPEPVGAGTWISVTSHNETRQCPCDFYRDLARPLGGQNYTLSYTSAAAEAYNMGRVILAGVDVPLPRFPLQ